MTCGFCHVYFIRKDHLRIERGREKGRVSRLHSASVPLGATKLSFFFSGSDAPLLPLKQSDMCLVCIAFASWVLKTANPQVGDAWKAGMLIDIHDNTLLEINIDA